MNCHVAGDFRVGFGFEIARARQLAAQMADDRALEKLEGSR